MSDPAAASASQPRSRPLTVSLGRGRRGSAGHKTSPKARRSVSPVPRALSPTAPLSTDAKPTNPLNLSLRVPEGRSVLFGRQLQSASLVRRTATGQRGIAVLQALHAADRTINVPRAVLAPLAASPARGGEGGVGERRARAGSPSEAVTRALASAPIPVRRDGGGPSALGVNPYRVKTAGPLEAAMRNAAAEAAASAAMAKRRASVPGLDGDGDEDGGAGEGAGPLMSAQQATATFVLSLAASADAQKNAKMAAESAAREKAAAEQFDRDYGPGASREAQLPTIMAMPGREEGDEMVGGVVVGGGVGGGGGGRVDGSQGSVSGSVSGGSAATTTQGASTVARPATSSAVAMVGAEWAVASERPIRHQRQAALTNLSTAALAPAEDGRAATALAVTRRAGRAGEIAPWSPEEEKLLYPRVTSSQALAAFVAASEVRDEVDLERTAHGQGPHGGHGGHGRRGSVGEGGRPSSPVGPQLSLPLPPDFPRTRQPPAAYAPRAASAALGLTSSSLAAASAVRAEFLEHVKRGSTAAAAAESAAKERVTAAAAVAALAVATREESKAEHSVSAHVDQLLASHQILPEVRAHLAGSKLLREHRVSERRFPLSSEPFPSAGEAGAAPPIRRFGTPDTTRRRSLSRTSAPASPTASPPSAAPPAARPPSAGRHSASGTAGHRPRTASEENGLVGPGADDDDRRSVTGAAPAPLPRHMPGTSIAFGSLVALESALGGFLELRRGALDAAGKVPGLQTETSNPSGGEEEAAVVAQTNRFGRKVPGWQYEHTVTWCTHAAPVPARSNSARESVTLFRVLNARRPRDRSHITDGDEIVLEVAGEWVLGASVAMFRPTHPAYGMLVTQTIEQGKTLGNVSADLKFSGFSSTSSSSASVVPPPSSSSSSSSSASAPSSPAGAAAAGGAAAQAGGAVAARSLEGSSSISSAHDAAQTPSTLQTHLWRPVAQRLGLLLDTRSSWQATWRLRKHTDAEATALIAAARGASSVQKLPSGAGAGAGAGVGAARDEGASQNGGGGGGGGAAAAAGPLLDLEGSVGHCGWVSLHLDVGHLLAGGRGPRRGDHKGEETVAMPSDVVVASEPPLSLLRDLNAALHTETTDEDAAAATAPPALERPTIFADPRAEHMHTVSSLTAATSPGGSGGPVSPVAAGAARGKTATERLAAALLGRPTDLVPRSYVDASLGGARPASSAARARMGVGRAPAFASLAVADTTFDGDGGVGSIAPLALEYSGRRMLREGESAAAELTMRISSIVGDGPKSVGAIATSDASEDALVAADDANPIRGLASVASTASVASVGSLAGGARGGGGKKGRLGASRPMSSAAAAAAATNATRDHLATSKGERHVALGLTGRISSVGAPRVGLHGLWRMHLCSSLLDGDVGIGGGAGASAGASAAGSGAPPGSVTNSAMASAVGAVGADEVPPEDRSAQPSPEADLEHPVDTRVLLATRLSTPLADRILQPAAASASAALLGVIHNTPGSGDRRAGAKDDAEAVGEADGMDGAAMKMMSKSAASDAFPSSPSPSSPAPSTPTLAGASAMDGGPSAMFGASSALSALRRHGQAVAEEWVGADAITDEADARIRAAALARKMEAQNAATPASAQGAAAFVSAKRQLRVMEWLQKPSPSGAQSLAMTGKMLAMAKKRALRAREAAKKRRLAAVRRRLETEMQAAIAAHIRGQDTVPRLPRRQVSAITTTMNGVGNSSGALAVTLALASAQLTLGRSDDAANTYARVLRGVSTAIRFLREEAPPDATNIVARLQAAADKVMHAESKRDEHARKVRETVAADVRRREQERHELQRQAKLQRARAAAAASRGAVTGAAGGVIGASGEAGEGGLGSGSAAGASGAGDSINSSNNTTTNNNNTGTNNTSNSSSVSALESAMGGGRRAPKGSMFQGGGRLGGGVRKPQLARIDVDALRKSFRAFLTAAGGSTGGDDGAGDEWQGGGVSDYVRAVVATAADSEVATLESRIPTAVWRFIDSETVRLRSLLRQPPSILTAITMVQRGFRFRRRFRAFRGLRAADESIAVQLAREEAQALQEAANNQVVKRAASAAADVLLRLDSIKARRLDQLEETEEEVGVGGVKGEGEDVGDDVGEEEDEEDEEAEDEEADGDMEDFDESPPHESPPPRVRPALRVNVQSAPAGGQMASIRGDLRLPPVGFETPPAVHKSRPMRRSEMPSWASDKPLTKREAEVAFDTLKELAEGLLGTQPGQPLFQQAQARAVEEALRRVGAEMGVQNTYMNQVLDAFHNVDAAIDPAAMDDSVADASPTAIAAAKARARRSRSRSSSPSQFALNGTVGGGGSGGSGGSGEDDEEDGEGEDEEGLPLRSGRHAAQEALRESDKIIATAESRVDEAMGAGSLSPSRLQRPHSQRLQSQRPIGGARVDGSAFPSSAHADAHSTTTTNFIVEPMGSPTRLLRRGAEGEEDGARFEAASATIERTFARRLGRANAAAQAARAQQEAAELEAKAHRRAMLKGTTEADEVLPLGAMPISTQGGFVGLRERLQRGDSVRNMLQTNPRHERSLRSRKALGSTGGPMVESLPNSLIEFRDEDELVEREAAAEYIGGNFGAVGLRGSQVTTVGLRGSKAAAPASESSTSSILTQTRVVVPVDLMDSEASRLLQDDWGEGGPVAEEAKEEQSGVGGEKRSFAERAVAARPYTASHAASMRVSRSAPRLAVPREDEDDGTTLRRRPTWLPAPSSTPPKKTPKPASSSSSSASLLPPVAAAVTPIVQHRAQPTIQSTPMRLSLAASLPPKSRTPAPSTSTPLSPSLIVLSKLRPDTFKRPPTTPVQSRKK